MDADGPISKPQLLPSQLGYLRNYAESLRTLATRPELGQPAVEQHIQESLEPVLQTEGADSAALRLAVAALSGGATGDTEMSHLASDAIMNSPLLREEGRQVAAGLLGMAMTLHGSGTRENEITQRLVEATSTALGTIRKSVDYENPSMRAAELAVLSFYVGVTLRDASFDADQQLMDFAGGLLPNAAV